jgi:hypothetical protein
MHDGKCVHAAGGQWAVKREEEGRRQKRREKQAGQVLSGGEVGRDAHPPTQQKQVIPPVPPPPFTSSNFALEKRVRELVTRDVAVVNTEKKAKRRRGGWMINSKYQKLLLVDGKYLTNQFPVKAQMNLSRAARGSGPLLLRAVWGPVIFIFTN